MSSVFADSGDLAFPCCVELRQLDIQRNYLHGAIPWSIGRLHNMLYLNLKDNEELSGSVPLNQLRHLSKLNRLSLVHCSFDNVEETVEFVKAELPRCKLWI